MYRALEFGKVEKSGKKADFTPKDVMSGSDNQAPRQFPSVPALILASIEALVEASERTTSTDCLEALLDDHDRSEFEDKRNVVRSWLQAVRGRTNVPLGNTYATEGVRRLVSAEDLTVGLLLHEMGIWGHLDAHDWLENDAALREGRRLLSAHRSLRGDVFWIITEADRSITTALLPDEY